VGASLDALSEIIQTHREKMDITQEQLAESLGVATMTIQFIEQGRRFPSLPMLIYICDRMGLNIRLDQSHLDEEHPPKPLLAAEGDLFPRSKRSKST
jgi:transcriptional regulator with XRE-family HTH domain